MTPLDMAVEKGNLRIVSVLLQSGAKFDKVGSFIIIRLRNSLFIYFWTHARISLWFENSSEFFDVIFPVFFGPQWSPSVLIASFFWTVLYPPPYLITPPPHALSLLLTIFAFVSSFFFHLVSTYGAHVCCWLFFVCFCEIIRFVMTTFMKIVFIEIFFVYPPPLFFFFLKFKLTDSRFFVSWFSILSPQAKLMRNEKVLRNPGLVALLLDESAIPSLQCLLYWLTMAVYLIVTVLVISHHIM